MKVVHDRNKNEFYIELANGKKAVLRYTWDGTTLTVFEITVPDSHNYYVLAAKLMEHFVEFIQRSSLKLGLGCDFAREYMKSQPHLAHLVDE